MSDSNKAEKLAAARRKLKEFQNQQRNKANHDNQTTLLSSQTTQRILPDELSHSQRESPLPISSEDTLNFFNTQSQPSIANYFQNSSKNEIFFDTVHNHMNGGAKSHTAMTSIPVAQTSVNDDQNICNTSSFPTSRAEISPASSFFSPNTDNSSLSSFIHLNSNIGENGKNFESNQITNGANTDEINALKLELEQANSKIKMQSDALDIITSEKEDLQTKLTKALLEVDSYKENVQSLNSQLEENLSRQKQLIVTIEELKDFQESLSSKEAAYEQNLNDLKERNHELQQSLETEKENNKALQNQLEETQSNCSMLSLKFQQLGIEVNNDRTKDYKSVHEECELWKSKHEELESRLKAILYDKERTEDQYRQYVVNLKEELENTNAELRQLSEENQMLANKISCQTEHISGLERQLQKASGDRNNDATITELQNEIDNLRQKAAADEEAKNQLTLQLTGFEESQRRIYELERDIENLKADMTNAHELQMAVESNKVAASQAIAQNTKLKNEFEQLHQMVEILNEEKVMLSKMLEEEKMKNAKLTTEHKSDNHEIMMNDAAINTDAKEDGENGAYGKANVEAMQLLQEKFKNVLDKMADLTDEKQQLEHLVTQLQCETETIEEYVALYQKQRSVLQQRARETDFKMERVIEEKERLLNILGSILTTEEFDCAFVKQLVANNLSVELTDELANSSTNATGYRYEHDQNRFPPKNDTVHHPSCPCCSGNLITV